MLQLVVRGFRLLPGVNSLIKLGLAREVKLLLVSENDRIIELSFILGSENDQTRSCISNSELARDSGPRRVLTMF